MLAFGIFHSMYVASKSTSTKQKRPPKQSFVNVALPGIEPGSRASETLVLSIVLQGRATNIGEKIFSKSFSLSGSLTLSH